MTEVIFKLKNVSKLYGGDQASAVELLQQGADKETVLKNTGCTSALWDINLEIKRGEIFVIIGLSGCGKSTLLRCLNRLNEPTSGEILYEDEDILKFDSKRLRQFRRSKWAMVFQSFGLLSHRDVLSNVAYPLEIQGIAKQAREEQARKYLQMVGLSQYEHTLCQSLSGGMRQRVGIARALCSDAQVLLMDEPFSALDPLVREDMQFELLQLQRKLNKTIVFITHDIDEAFKLGDKVAIMRDGRIIQVATPVEMSRNPQDDYVKKFIDSADRTKVLTAEDIMTTPASLIKISDTAEYALHEMKKYGLSSVYVVDGRLRLKGILLLNDAVELHRGHKTISEEVLKEVSKVSQTQSINEFINLVAETPYPVAVVDEDNMLQGLITRASVLSSIG